jgi:hypothetical protein
MARTSAAQLFAAAAGQVRKSSRLRALSRGGLRLIPFPFDERNILHKSLAGEA